MWQMATVRDISHHNTIPNYSAFRTNASDVQIKITESNSFLDPAGPTHWVNCHGMRRAPYHFARPVGVPSQISWFLARKAQIGPWERPDMLDCEFSGITGAFIRALKDEYRAQSGISKVQIYVGLHDILTTCPPGQWWDEDVYMQVARYRKIGAPIDPDNWRNHLGFDHIGLSTYQWDNATPFYSGGPVGDISFDRVFVGGENMDLTKDNLTQIRRAVWGTRNDPDGGHYEGLSYVFNDAAANNPEGGFADQISNSFRTMLTGIATTMTPEDRAAVIEGVTNNLISHFEENPPTFTVDYKAIAREVNDDAARRQAE